MIETEYVKEDAIWKYVVCLRPDRKGQLSSSMKAYSDLFALLTLAPIRRYTLSSQLLRGHISKLTIHRY